MANSSQPRMCICRAAKLCDIEQLENALDAIDPDQVCNKINIHDNLVDLNCLNRGLHYLCFHDSSRQREPEALRLVLEAGADIEAMDGIANNPLKKATCSNSITAMEMLIQRGAKIHIGLLRIAVLWGHHEATKLLLSKGAIPTTEHVALASPCVSIIKMLHESNPELIADRSWQYSAMAGLVENEDYDQFTSLILDYAIDINTPDPEYPLGLRSLIHVAAECVDVKFYKKLIEVGLHLNPDDETQRIQQGTQTALYIREQLDITGIPSDDVIEWKSPLYVAAKYNKRLVVPLLEDGAHIMAVTKKGRFPLHIAFCSLQIHLFLCEPYCCPLDVRDLKGLTALMLQVNRDEYNVDAHVRLPNEAGCIMLLQHGASCEGEYRGKRFLYHMALRRKLTPNVCSAAVYSGNDLPSVLKEIDAVLKVALKRDCSRGYDWLVSFLTQPELLKMSAVRSIRTQLRKVRPGLSIWSSIFKLPLPKAAIQLITLNGFQPDFGPWIFYGTVHQHILKEYHRVHETSMQLQVV